ncbi:MAG: transporter [Betaproteobacteria bacterium]
MTDVTKLVHAHPELAIFVAIVLGFLLGRIHIKGIGLGTVVGTLIAGLALGILFTPEIPDLLKWAFFDLFLFAIGYATGPQFFAGLKKEALPQIGLALVVSISGLVTALAVAWFFKFDPGTAAGVASGGLTQSAALGTALATIAELPVDDATKALWSSHVPLADAVTYVFGDIGVILFVVAAAPLLLRVKVRDAAIALEDELAGDGRGPDAKLAYQRFVYRALRLDKPEFDGLTVHEFESDFADARLYVERIRRDGVVIDDLTQSTRLHVGDVLAVGARRTAMVGADTRIGPEVDDDALLSFPLKEAQVVVTRRNIAGRKISDIAIEYGRGVFLTRITRGQLDLPVSPGTVPHRGDVLHVVGSPLNIERVAHHAGFIDADPDRFALPFLAAGLSVGILFGLVSYRFGTVPLGLGTSCAILLTGLLTGWARSRYPLFGGIPDSATRILQDVGLTVFIAIVGLTAGPHAVAVLHERGVSFFLTVFAAGAIVTIVPQLLGFFVGAKILKMSLPILLGGLAGAQTATPGLNALKEAGGNNVFVLGFTVPYAINNVLLTLWGTVIVTVVYSWGR